MDFFKLKRGSAWPSFHVYINVFLRALGVSVIVSAFRSLRHVTVGKGYDEPKKVAIRESRVTALMRAIIHIVPVTVALWEVTINWNTYLLGAAIRNQAYYQFGAKVHEMTAQASLAAIVFSYVRYEISLGQGLPFGALFSGLQISQASYLWSMEFWGSMSSNHLPARRRFGMILVITTAIALAATVGPSSAILLIPRLDYWPAGATNIWLNATSQDLWPDRYVFTFYTPSNCGLIDPSTDGALIPASCQVSDPLLVENSCPSSGWQAIENYLSFTNNLLPAEIQSTYDWSSSPAYVDLSSASSIRQLRIIHQSPTIPKPGLDSELAVATAQQAAVADTLTRIGALWSLALTNVTTKGHGSVLNQLDAVHSIDTGYYQPYTIASCEHDRIYGPEDQNPVAFPPPPGSNEPMLNTSALDDSILDDQAYAFVYPGISRSQILDTPGPPGENRLRWVELPQNPFNGTAIGAVILLPRAPMNTSQEVLMCNLGAGWGTSKLNTSTFMGDAQTILGEVGLTPSRAGVMSIPASKKRFFQEDSLDNVFAYFFLPVFPQRPLVVTEDWARYLNPTIANSNTTLFHHLMASNISAKDTAISAKIILPSLLANGLSKIGSTSQLQGTVKTAVQSDGSLGMDGNYWFSGKGDVFDVIPAQDWVKLHVSSKFEGFAYNTRGATTKVAISILLTYCLVALSHTLYAGITGISSTCWDSIGEVTALAVNSPPTILLRNTCAGITELNIFKLPVRVLAIRDNEQSDGEHLELVFAEVDEKTTNHTTIKENRVYGTMPSFVLEKKEKIL